MSGDIEQYTIVAEDGERIALNHYPRTNDRVVILAHGFYNNKDTVLFRQIASVLAKYYAVISFDFRGHGGSSGVFTWTTSECKDLRAVIAFAREKGYRSIGVIGFSLGAAVALIEASRNRAITSLIAVSSPANFWRINFHFWEEEMLNDLKLNFGPKGRGKGVRPGNPFMRKITPKSIVSCIAPTPVFFIHGENDWLIKPQHSEALYLRAGEPKKLLVMQKAGHAEKIFDSFPEEFEQVCISWFAETMKGEGLHEK